MPVIVAAIRKGETDRRCRVYEDGGAAMAAIEAARKSGKYERIEAGNVYLIVKDMDERPEAAA